LTLRSPSLEERTQEQSPANMVFIDAAVDLERGAIAEIALEDLPVVADGRKNAALPVLVQTNLLRSDRHRTGAPRVPPGFRPLRAHQRVHCPRDDR